MGAGREGSQVYELNRLVRRAGRDADDTGAEMSDDGTMHLIGEINRLRDLLDASRAELDAVRASIKDASDEGD